MSKRSIEIEITDCNLLGKLLGAIFQWNPLYAIFSEPSGTFSKVTENIKFFFKKKTLPEEKVKKDFELRRSKEGFVLIIKGNEIPAKIISKKGAEMMKLQIDIDEINLKNLLDEIIKSRKGQDHNGKKGEALFAMLDVLNQKVDDDDKWKLLSMVFDWMNENDILDNALQAYLDKYKELEGKDGIINTLDKLDLRVGNITLTTD